MIEKMCLYINCVILILISIVESDDYYQIKDKIKDIIDN